MRQDPANIELQNFLVNSPAPGQQDQANYWETVTQYIKQLESMFQLRLSRVAMISDLGPMARIHENYTTYLRQLASEKNSEDLRQALTEEFYLKLHQGTLEKKDGDSATTKLYSNQISLIDQQHADISNITRAYLDNDKQSKIETEVGKQYQEVMKHFTQIGAARSLKPILEQLNTETTETQDRAHNLQLVADHLHNAFHEIQEGYYTRLENYIKDAITALHNKVKNNATQNQRGFKLYCETVLFNDGPEASNGIAQQLVSEYDYSIQYLNEVRHELLYHLKPAIYEKRNANAIEIKQLKKNISHLMQAMGLHTRLKKEEDQEDTSLSNFLKRRYTPEEQLDSTNWLISEEKQSTRLTNEYCTIAGITTAGIVGSCEGTVGGAALWAAIRTSPLAIPFGSIVFLSGGILNYLLLKLDSISLFKALGFGQFNLDNEGKELSPLKQALNILSYTLALTGTGFVFASMFLTEFLEVAFDFLSSLHPGIQIPAKIAAFVIAGLGFVAELFGISALIHMENNKIIKNGLQAICNDVAFYFHKKFYVALPDEWNSLEGFTANSLTIIKQLPRLFVSLLLTAASITVMAYYIKMTFVLFSGMVSQLAATYFAASALTASAIGYLTAGINAITTFMTFTLPLGKMVIQVLELVLELALFSGSLATATALAIVGLPLAIYARAPGTTYAQACIKYFTDFMASGISAYFWLSSNSDLDSAVAQIQAERTTTEAERAATEATETTPAIPEANRSDWERFKDHLSTFIEKCVIYPFCLVANSLGQAFLFLPRGLKSISNPVHLMEAFIQGFRSFAMNLKAILNNMALRQGGNPASAETTSLISYQPNSNMLFKTSFDNGGEIEPSTQERSFLPSASMAPSVA